MIRLDCPRWIRCKLKRCPMRRWRADGHRQRKNECEPETDHQGEAAARHRHVSVRPQVRHAAGAEASSRSQRLQASAWPKSLVRVRRGHRPGAGHHRRHRHRHRHRRRRRRSSCHRRHRRQPPVGVSSRVVIGGRNANSGTSASSGIPSSSSPKSSEGLAGCTLGSARWRGGGKATVLLPLAGLVSANCAVVRSPGDLAESRANRDFAGVLLEKAPSFPTETTATSGTKANIGQRPKNELALTRAQELSFSYRTRLLP